MKHVLCVHLRCWPIDRLCRRNRGLRHKALVLVTTVGGRQMVAHASAEAPAGIHAGMTLAEARARHAALLHLPAEPADDLRGLEALGRWLMRFSPQVCVYPPDSLFLDGTGLERIFGPGENLRRRVAEALGRLGLRATVAMAPTPGAAWALAAFNRGVVVDHNPLDALAHLPPSALRLEGVTLDRLEALGIESVGALIRLSRADLAVRFGRIILDRIDQAAGSLAEPLIFLEHRAPIEAGLEFDGAIESLEAIHEAVRRLLAEVVERLKQRGLGARELRVRFRPPYAPVVEKIVRLTRPSRNEADLFRLLSCALETLETEEGFIGASLWVAAADRVGDEQTALVGGEEERDAAELDHLVERLRARLDRAARQSVEWAELVESHVPERAFRCRESAVEARPAHEAAIYRPLCLLRPRAVRVIVMPSESRDGQPVSFSDGEEVHRLIHVFGPERITGQWWNGRWKTRDYFDALDGMGNRYWIFRVAGTGDWFLHGVFE